MNTERHEDLMVWGAGIIVLDNPTITALIPRMITLLGYSRGLCMGYKYTCSDPEASSRVYGSCPSCNRRRG